MSEPIKQSAIFERAKEILSEKGWTQGSVARRGGARRSVTSPDADCYCVGGAINLAQLDVRGRRRKSESFFYLPNEEYRNLTQRFCELVGVPSPRDIVDFNDDPGMTKEKILASLDMVIVTLKSRGL